MRHEVVERELRRLRYEFGERKGWWCTDNDSLQHSLKVADKRYALIEKIWLDITHEDEGYPYKSYVVVGMNVDLTESTYNDMSQYISGFYNSLEVMMERYDCPLEDLYGLIAECAFENNMECRDYESVLLTEEEADYIIKTFCKGVK